MSGHRVYAYREARGANLDRAAKCRCSSEWRPPIGRATPCERCGAGKAGMGQPLCLECWEADHAAG